MLNNKSHRILTKSIHRLRVASPPDLVKLPKDARGGLSHLDLLRGCFQMEIQSPKKVFVLGWENAAGKLRQKRQSTARTKFIKPRCSPMKWSISMLVGHVRVSPSI